jgi:hypothetical protein
VVLATTATVQAALGDREAALATLGKALSAGYRDAAALRANPYLQPLRSDPRYAALLRQHGVEP